ncbi:hypothetical protein Leryth_002933 [Lithospermum erythrorhizon]|nr:hypothetical protein Leryth_002933 [Lithospermum erythrorhizon]
MIQLHTLFNSLHKCKSFLELKQIHALLTTLFTSPSLFDPFATKLLHFSANTSSSSSLQPNIDYAHRIFLKIHTPNVFHYNAIIRSYSNTKSNPNKPLSIFIRMLGENVDPDYMTYPFVIKATAKICDLGVGGCVHGMVLRNGFVSDLYISNSLIHMYGSCRDVFSAQKVFDDMPVRNLVSWNSIVDGYGKCGEVGMMREVFDAMFERDVVTWSALVDGYVKEGEYAEALAVFERMMEEGVKGNEVTMVSILCACAHLGALELGRIMHEYIVENRLPLTLVLNTSLVDMYAKCGAIQEAVVVFRGVSKRNTDVLIWNAMISGLATHGFTDESLEMYKEMQSLGVAPDEITYLCLLSACAHGGLVKDARYLFGCLEKDFVRPKNEHYACMVDVLSRAGLLLEAYKFIHEMPIEPTPSMLGALLNGCMNHRNLELAEIVGRKLIDLDPDHDGRYIGLSNVYAIVKRYEEARTTREAMETRGVKKYPGSSVVEIFGSLHRFIARDKIHPQSDKIYFMLDIIVDEMKLDAELEAHNCCL